MNRLYVAALVALLASLVVGVAFADDADDTSFELSIDKLEQYYGNLLAPGVPDSIGPDDHNNEHCGDRGWKAPTGNNSFNPRPILIRISLDLVFIIPLF